MEINVNELGMINEVSNEQFEALSKAAWEARENAIIYGKTMVGAAVLTSDGSIYSGCNVEHQYRSHDVHAEVNVITSMVASGKKELIAILVAAERERFTPCGSCLDWIFQFGGPKCTVGYQTTKNGRIKIFLACELMPFYPM